MWQPWSGELANELGMCGMVFSWTSMILLAKRNRKGWAVGFVGDLFWLGATLDSGVPSFLLNDLVFTAIRVWGWWSWRTHE